MSNLADATILCDRCIGACVPAHRCMQGCIETQLSWPRSCHLLTAHPSPSSSQQQPYPAILSEPVQLHQVLQSVDAQGADTGRMLDAQKQVIWMGAGFSSGLGSMRISGSSGSFIKKDTGQAKYNRQRKDRESKISRGHGEKYPKGCGLDRRQGHMLGTRGSHWFEV